MVSEKKLTKLVADKAGMNRKEVEAQLDELVQNVQTAAKEGKSLKIEGLGTFKSAKNTTFFEPDDLFQTEINQKYAGMKPIELMGSFKESAAAIPAETIERPSLVKKQKKPKPKSGIKQNTPTLTEKTAGKDQKEKVKAQKEQPAEPSVKPKEEKKTVADDKADASGIILIIIAIIVAILLAGWLLYNSGVFSGSDAAAIQSPANGSVVTDGVSDQNNSNTNDLSTASTRLETANSPSITLDESSDNFNKAIKEVSLYGLRGTAQDRAKDGYTIVVHSLVRKKHAFETLESINQQGYRTVVLTANVNGIKYWRLGIGQFKTITDAQKAAKTLPEPYKSNHFIKRQQQ